MKKLTDSIWLTEPIGESDRPVLAIVKGATRFLIVDGGNCPNHALAFVQSLLEQGMPEADYIALTHSHCDHVFGLSALKGLVIANSLTMERIEALRSLSWNDAEVADRVKNETEHEMTASMLKQEMPGDRTNFLVRKPDIVFTNRLQLDLGGLTCILETIGGDHASDSTVIHIPEERVAFIGDCLYLRSIDQNIIELLFAQLFGFDADIYVDSHETKLVSRAELRKRHEEFRKRNKWQ